MPYDELLATLTNPLTGGDVMALPDGSVDTHYSVRTPTGDRIETRERFVNHLSTRSVRSIRLTKEDRRPGGQAVNAATQIHLLGNTPTLYGHLDDAVFRDQPFETHSLGEPATVHILSFAKHELMFSIESEDILDWELADLFEVVSVPPAAWLSEQFVVLQNWVGFPGMTEALRTFAEIKPSGTTIVFDPGDITTAGREPLRSLGAALRSASDAVRVVLTANRQELRRLVTALVEEGTERPDVVTLREALDLSAVVRHSESDAAVAADDHVTVPNFDARTVSRRTGAGDRFNGGLTAGLASDLPWRETLALGNACATFFVETGETATRSDLRELVADRAGDM